MIIHTVNTGVTTLVLKTVSQSLRDSLDFRSQATFKACCGFERCAVICTKTIWMQRTVSSMLLPRLLARSSTSNCRWSHKKRDNAAGGTPGLMRAQMPYTKKIGKGIHFSKSNISRLNSTIKLPHKDCFPGRYKRLEQDANWQVPTLVLLLHTRGLGTSQKVQKEVSLSVCLHCDDKVDTMKRAKKSVCLTTT